MSHEFFGGGLTETMDTVKTTLARIEGKIDELTARTIQIQSLTVAQQQMMSALTQGIEELKQLSFSLATNDCPRTFVILPESCIKVRADYYMF